MSETLEVIRNRRSYRQFKPEQVDLELLDQIAEAGKWAATGRGLQSPIIVSITNTAVIRMLSEMNAEVYGKPGDPFHGAPAIFAVLADKNVPTYIYDGSLVMGNMMLAAEDLGLGSCWIHRAKEVFEMEKAKNFLRAIAVPAVDDYEGIGFLAVGIPAGEIPEAEDRKKDYIHYID